MDIVGITSYTAEDKERILDLLFDENEVDTIAGNAEELFTLYCLRYQGVPLTKKWANRKRMSRNSFWKGLGWSDGKGAFFQDFYVEMTPVEFGGETVYQIENFEVIIPKGSHFPYAADRIENRRLLPNNEISFVSYKDEPTPAFCSFMTSLMIQGALDAGF